MATTTYKKKIVHFTQQSYYDDMVANGSVTVDGVTYTYSPSDTIYVTPFNIGDFLIFEDVEVESTDWVDNATDPEPYSENYSYKAVIDCEGASSSLIANVIFADEQMDGEVYSDKCATGTDTVTIYSNSNEGITIPLILIGMPVIMQFNNAEVEQAMDEIIGGVDNE